MNIEKDHHTILSALKTGIKEITILKFFEIDVSTDESLRQEMTAMANGARSIPQIFVDGIYVGDYNKIYKLEKEKKLDNLLGLE